jgi:hypothetical protein
MVAARKPTIDANNGIPGRIMPNSTTPAVTPASAAETRSFKIREGSPFPRGATWDGAGTNFALFSAHATKVEICLFANPAP